MENQPKEEGTSPETRRSPLRSPNIWVLLFVLVLLSVLFFSSLYSRQSVIDEKYFQAQLEAKNIESVELGKDYATGKFKKPPTRNKKELNKEFYVWLGEDDMSRAALKQKLDDPKYALKTWGNKPPDNTQTWIMLGLFIVTIGFVVFIYLSYRRTQNQLLGGGFLSGFSKSPAKRYEATKQAVTFNDVAGVETVKADLLEIVEYLKNPEKFQKLGGRVPKGVLLLGPPGTGKTLLARAVAGEAGVPFFSVSGSEFIQMFVGVGASRVRDLFKNAKDSAPAIIFIDEIDAVGRQRGAGLGGGHDEREQTLNQILSEMDGFTQSEAVIVLAATNRPDVLDPALLRPGRFDRHITVDRPTKKGRTEIFKVHVRDVPLAKDVDLETLAAGAVGLTGADIRNIVNEAALWAARHNKTKVDMEDFEYARDKILMGGKRDEVLSDSEKEKTAYHEAGHTLIAWNLPGAHRVHKVTIIPRGRSLGSTQMFPSEDRMNMSERELRDNLVVLLGGRAAEKLIYEITTVGAENDLERATNVARRMVTHWGMSERLGPVSYKLSDDDPFLGREIHQQRQFSEHTMELIDEEVARMLHESADQALDLLKEKRAQLDKLAHSLIKDEELDEREITALIGPSVQSRAQSNGKPSVEIGPKDMGEKKAVAKREAN